MSAVQIRHGVDKRGRVRPHVLVAVVDGRTAVAASRIPGTNQWGIVPAGPRTPATRYEVVDGEQTARAVLAQAQTGHPGGVA